jgi:hypothetical protein
MKKKPNKGEVDELRSLLNQWDPIGCAPPPDEYDCLLLPLLNKLQSGCNQDFVKGFLDREIGDHFGMNPRSCGTEEFAKKVMTWYSGLKNPDRKGV